MLASGNSNDLCTEQKQNNCSQPKSCAERNDLCTEQRKYLTPMCCVAHFYMFSHFYTSISIVGLLNLLKEFQIILSNLHEVLFNMANFVCEIRTSSSY